MTKDTAPKMRKIVSFNNLSLELQEELKHKYPYGFTEAMMRIDRGPGDFFYAVVLETEEVNYLVKIDVKIDGQLDEEEDKGYVDYDIKGADDLADEEDEEEDRRSSSAADDESDDE